MVDVSELLVLAERCEKATGPDRELGRRIWMTAKPKGYSAWEGRRRGLLDRGLSEERKRLELADMACRAAPTYTASIDAAMTLVPDGCGFTLSWLGRPCLAFIAVPGLPHSDELCNGAAATPALALCAAALRAIAAMGEGDVR